MEKERSVKLLIISILFMLIIGLTVAFAALSSSLNINGTAYLDAAKWGIRFENLSSPTKIGSANVTGTAKIEESKAAEITGINVNLSIPGDKIVYTVDLVNKGTINAKIDNIEKTQLTSEQQRYLTFKVTDQNGYEIKQGDILSAGETKKITITIEFIKDLTKEDLPKQTSTISLSYKLNFVQTDDNTTIPSSSIENIVWYSSNYNANTLNAKANLIYSGFSYVAGVHDKDGTKMNKVRFVLDTPGTLTIGKVSANFKTIIDSEQLTITGNNGDIKEINLNKTYTLENGEHFFIMKSGDTCVFKYTNRTIPATQGDLSFMVNVGNEKARLNSTESNAIKENLSVDFGYEKKLDNDISSVLSGKTLSILGDSISTFQGYSNSTINNNTIGNNVVWYNASQDRGITNVNDSWWMKIINNNNMKLLVNNSWSGSTVLTTSNNNSAKSIAYNTNRPINLHDNTDDNTFKNGTEPDIIAIYIGINDFNTNIDSLGTFEDIDFNTLIVNNNNSYSYDVADTIAEAYSIMCHRVKTRYTSSDIYLFTLLPNTWKVNDQKLEEFNSIIKKIANKYNFSVVDLYSNSGITRSNIKTYLHDGLHPNTLGMIKIADAFESLLLNKYKNNNG